MKTLDAMAVAFGDVGSVPVSKTVYTGFLFGKAKTKERMDPQTGELLPAKEIDILYLQDKEGNYYATRSEGLVRQLESVKEQLESVEEITLEVKEKDLGGGRRVKRFIRA